MPALIFQLIIYNMALEKQLSPGILKVSFPRGVRGVALDVDESIVPGDTYSAVAIARGVLDKTAKIYERYLAEVRAGNPMAYLHMKTATMKALTADGRKPLKLDEWLEILDELGFAEGVLELIEYCNLNNLPVGFNSSSIVPYIDMLVLKIKKQGLRIDFASGNTRVKVNQNGEIIDLEQNEPFPHHKWLAHLEVCRRFGIFPEELLMVDDGDTGVEIAENAKVVAFTRKHVVLNALAIGYIDTFSELQSVLEAHISEIRSELLVRRDPQDS